MKDNVQPFFLTLIIFLQSLTHWLSSTHQGQTHDITTVQENSLERHNIGSQFYSVLKWKSGAYITVYVQWNSFYLFLMFLLFILAIDDGF